MKYKTIKIRKVGGGTRLQKVQVMASGKYKFVKNSKKTKSYSKPKKTRKVKTMARKRRYYRKKSKVKGMFTGVGRYVGPVVYGALRGRMSDFINNTKIAQSIPNSAYTDEALMFGSLVIASKLGVGRSGILRSIISHGKTIELSRIGQTIGEQGFSLGAPKNNSLF